MITSTIGRIFLDSYNEKYCTNYDAQTFFIEIFYELFFNHEKYMMSAGNSPLENPRIGWDKMIKGKIKYLTPTQRKDRFIKFIDKAKTGIAESAMARGYPVLDTTNVTQSQVSSLDIKFDQDNIYLSWIGDALGVCISGGLSILFFKKEILLDIYEGWKLYRNILNNVKMHKGNQVNSWNAQWLAHRYGRNYNDKNPLSGFKIVDKSDNGIISLDTISWTDVIISIAMKYNNSAKLMGYVYSIGANEANTTIGFIPFDLSQIRKPIHLYQTLFNMDNGLEAQKLWGSGRSFAVLCRNGSIGLKAMQPKELEEFFKAKKMPKKNRDKELTIKYNVYQTWILAMLNNDELWDKSQALAQILHSALTSNNKTLSTRPTNLVDEVLKSVNKKQFINAITELLPLIAKPEELENNIKEVHLMPNDNVPYFLTLIRFHFYLSETKSK